MSWGADAAPEKSETGTGKKGGKIHNRILASLLRVLRPNEDERQNELTLKILAGSIELVAGCVSLCSALMSSH